MHYFLTIAALVALAIAAPILEPQTNADLFTVELAPGDTRAVTETEKFALIDVRISP